MLRCLFRNRFKIMAMALAAMKQATNGDFEVHALADTSKPTSGFSSRGHAKHSEIDGICARSLYNRRVTFTFIRTGN